jgi:hypothetical protein
MKYLVFFSICITIILACIFIVVFSVGATGDTFGSWLDPYLPEQGGTGTSTPPTIGQILIGDGTGQYDLTNSPIFINSSTTNASTTNLYVMDHIGIQTEESFHSLEIGGVSMKINTNYKDSDVSIWFGNIGSGQDRFWLDNWDTTYYNDTAQTFVLSDRLWIESDLTVVGNASTTGSMTANSLNILDVANINGDADGKIITYATGTKTLLGAIGTNNFIFGSPSSITTAAYNYAVGQNALASLASGENNVAIGYAALTSATSSDYNVAIGPFALKNNIASFNLAIGRNSLYYNTTGAYNFGLGNASLFNNISGNYNMGLGSGALISNTTGQANIALGTYSLYHNTTGNNNIGMGYRSIYNGNATNTLAIGYRTAYGTTISDHQNNAFLGYQSGYAITTGDNNTCLGNSSCETITSGDSNIILGYDLEPSSATASNEINIGNILRGVVNSGTEYLTVTTRDLVGGGAFVAPLIQFTNNNAIGQSTKIGAIDNGLFISNADDGLPLLAFAGAVATEPYAIMQYSTTTQELVLNLDTASTSQEYFTFGKTEINGDYYPIIKGYGDNGMSDVVALNNTLILTGESPFIGFFDTDDNTYNLLQMTADGILTLGGISSYRGATSTQTGLKETITTAGSLFGQSYLYDQTCITFKDGVKTGFSGPSYLGATCGKINDLNSGDGVWQGGMSFLVFASTTLGTYPLPFTKQELKEHEIDFYPSTTTDRYFKISQLDLTGSAIGNAGYYPILGGYSDGAFSNIVAMQDTIILYDTLDDDLTSLAFVGNQVSSIGSIEYDNQSYTFTFDELLGDANVLMTGLLTVQGTATSTLAGNLDVAGNIEGGNIYTGDLFFANGWKITEAEKLGRDYSGLVVFNGEGTEIMEITNDGIVNEQIKKLEERIAELENKQNWLIKLIKFIWTKI